MNYPSLTDTIVAVSTGWVPAAVGVVRLSGPEALQLLAALRCEHVEPQSRIFNCRIKLANVRSEAQTPLTCSGLELPAQVLWFAGPRSYTGQDVVELRLAGSLPLLRMVTDRLIELGARRALPGEFTARALLNGRLDRRQVDAVLDLIEAHDSAGARAAARALHQRNSSLDELADRMLELLSAVEAGIDFVEEEDVRFISSAELASELERLLRELEALAVCRRLPGAGKPHVALAGLPNAGKSTLFNALVGDQRAIVSPVLGTTRDVLRAEVELAGARVVLQDCAGLGSEPDELEAAAHLAAEQAADQADVVLWLHACDQPWDRPLPGGSTEADLAARLDSRRRVLVVTKTDLPHAPAPEPPIAFAARVEVAARAGRGLGRLAEVVAQVLAAGGVEGGGVDADDLRPVSGPLRAALELARGGAVETAAEVVALELRTAVEGVRDLGSGPVAEEVLGRIMARFCVGK